MKSSSQAVIRQIIAHVKCSVCSHHFGASDIQVIGKRENVWAMRVNCRECRTRALLLAVVDDRGTQPIYTDLAPEEWDRFKDAQPISVDDVIRIHDFVASYDGDFSEIMDEPLPEE